MGCDPISLGITVGLSALSMAMGAMKKIEGPRLTDLKVTVADYGTPLNYFRGIRCFDGAPIFWAEPIKEKKVTSKTKGGKYNNYQYRGTWAVAIADHLIDGVTRIWFDKHLIYDATGTGPIMPAALFSAIFTGDGKSGGGATGPFSLGHHFNVNENIRIYLGTATQEPDPRMLATIEAEQGAGSCSAYRNVSYIVFEEVPLEKVGNRIPQIKVEAVTLGTTPLPWDSVDGGSFIDTPGLSTDFQRLVMNPAGTTLRIWDMATRTVLMDQVQPYAIGSPIAVSSAGTIYYTSNIGPGFLDDGLIAAYPDGTGAAVATALANKADDLQCITAGDGIERVCMLPYADFETAQIYELGALHTIALGFTASQYILDGYGDIWALGATYAADTVARMTRVVNASGRVVATEESFAHVKGIGIPGYVGCHNIAESHYFIVADGTWYLIDDTTWAIKDSGVWAGGSVHFRFISPDQNSAYQIGNVTTREFSLRDNSTIRVLTMADWLNEDTHEAFYDPINHALVSRPQFDDWYTWRFLDRLGSDGVLLSEIADMVADMVGIDAADVITSDLNQTVQGWSFTHGSGRSALEPLLDGYDSIVRPHGFAMQFLKLGASSGGTIDVQNFVRNGDARYKITLAQDTDLPRRATFNFADRDHDQQTNSVLVQRPIAAVDGVRDTTIDMTTWVSDVDEARQLGERWFRRKWFARETIAASVTSQLLALEPGDVRTLTFDGESMTARLTKMPIGADGVIGCEWERDDPTVALLSGTTGATMDGREPTVMPVPIPSRGFLLDIPLVRDVDDSTVPQLYYAAGPFNPTGFYPGTTMLESTDGGVEFDTDWAAIGSTDGATWGQATDALADASPAVWDRGSSVNVTFKNGTPASTTEALCDSNPLLNLAWIGDTVTGQGEMIQFSTATLELDGSYTLSGFKRGRRGTEWATGGHAVGDSVVLLNEAFHSGRGASDVGSVLYFNAVTSGRNPSSGFPVTLNPYTGASHKPYAPTDVTATKNAGSGDWTINWIRRSRIGGAWGGGFSLPLGETTEAYEVDILNGSGTVLHTYSVTSPTATYSAAAQTAYAGGGVAVGNLHVNVYQISALVGRGFVAAASF